MMPEVLMVAALKLSHPVLLLVLMEASNAALPGGSLVAERPQFSAAALYAASAAMSVRHHTLRR
jgi:hypothetical protein